MLEDSLVICQMLHKKVTGRVVGCDPDIGLTIVNNSNSDEFLLCVTFNPDEPTKRAYEKIFEYVVEVIRKGTVDTEQLVRFISSCVVTNIGCAPSEETCPFNQ